MADEQIPVFNTEVKNLTGQRFGRLLVEKYIGIDNRHNALWQCRCDCGTLKTASTGNLRRGSVSSCGCFRRDKARADHTTHGQTHSREFRIWTAVKTRTLNPNDHGFARYGAEGITICERWRDSFEKFLADMGPMPPDKHSIDRIDNSRGYEPGNCRWATWREQQSNRTNNRKITFNGETLTTAEWARRIGIHRTSLRRRLDDGWSVESALKTPSTDRESRRIFDRSKVL